MGKAKIGRRWRYGHRWLGLTVALPVLVLAITGVLLNHLNSLPWTQRPLPPVLAGRYGVALPETVRGTPVAGQWYAQAGAFLFPPRGNKTACRRPFRGVVALDHLHVAGCDDQLVLFTAQGREMERISTRYGIPAFESIGEYNHHLVLDTGTDAVRFDLDQLASRPLPADTRWQPAVIDAVPASLARRVQRASVPSSLNWERLLQDLHSGRLGAVGPWIMDLAALIFLGLATSGMVIWWRSR